MTKDQRLVLEFLDPVESSTSDEIGMDLNIGVERVNGALKLLVAQGKATRCPNTYPTAYLLVESEE
ncbi:hypothetical protein [Hahella ganghwensis]|uniref:hypothetical protein n=1 Tax=Hahella ganghwensis TaxID=286420 RepID=UPI00037C508A|nr:hypothetical protein [Hahella ganghwensis]